jgi:hypothetical protein
MGTPLSHLSAATIWSGHYTCEPCTEQWSLMGCHSTCGTSAKFNSSLFFLSFHVITTRSSEREIKTYEFKNSCLRECDKTGRSSPTFRREIMPPSQRCGPSIMLLRIPFGTTGSVNAMRTSNLTNVYVDFSANKSGSAPELYSGGVRFESRPNRGHLE